MPDTEPPPGERCAWGAKGDEPSESGEGGSGEAGDWKGEDASTLAPLPGRTADGVWGAGGSSAGGGLHGAMLGFAKVGKTDTFMPVATQVAHSQSRL